LNGRKLTVTRDVLEWDGRRSSFVETVKHPGAVAILALDLDGRVILERQYRHSVGRFIYEIPAGTLEEGEEPAACAARELLEETGYRADTISEVGSIYTSPGYSSEVLHLFVAKASPGGRQSLEDDEAISISLHPLEEALELVKESGTFDAKSTVLLLLALYDRKLLS
jgi:ADP-ribose pyrophosphatase